MTRKKSTNEGNSILSNVRLVTWVNARPYNDQTEGWQRVVSCISKTLSSVRLTSCDASRNGAVVNATGITFCVLDMCRAVTHLARPLVCLTPSTNTSMASRSGGFISVRIRFHSNC